MMNAISSMSSSPAGHQKSSCDTTVSNARGDNQKDDEEDDTFARQSRKEVARALTLHRKLNTVAVCVALSSVCIPVFTKHQRGAPHLNTWSALSRSLSAPSLYIRTLSRASMLTLRQRCSLQDKVIFQQINVLCRRSARTSTS